MAEYCGVLYQSEITRETITDALTVDPNCSFEDKNFHAHHRQVWATVSPKPVKFYDLHALPLPTCQSGENARVLRIVVISDTHESHKKLVLPPGDVLLHCGDCFKGISPFRCDKKALEDFFRWLNKQAFSIKIFIAGNHDSLLARLGAEEVRRMAAPALYLCDESAVIEPYNLRVFGSPRSLPNWRISPNTAFQSKKMDWEVSPISFDSPAQENRLRKNEDQRETTGDGVCSPATSTLPTEVRVTARLEAVCGGRIDILMTHQGFHSRLLRENTTLMRYISECSPRLFHCGGHTHDGHGKYYLRTVNQESLAAPNGGSSSALVRDNNPNSEELDPGTSGRTAFLSLNASIQLRRAICGSKRQLPLVLDVEV